MHNQCMQIIRTSFSDTVYRNLLTRALASRRVPSDISLYFDCFLGFRQIPSGPPPDTLRRWIPSLFRRIPSLSAGYPHFCAPDTLSDPPDTLSSSLDQLTSRRINPHELRADAAGYPYLDLLFKKQAPACTGSTCEGLRRAEYPVFGPPRQPTPDTPPDNLSDNPPRQSPRQPRRQTPRQPPRQTLPQTTQPPQNPCSTCSATWSV